ncbi:F-box/FBD/LRR-repeat protein At1g13570-like [Silene latifolia]|uniref:F-box/FBD/LRR-repeat protein At1g13570-like n=1 Tax=Silene latifolia TaxID=37657 RepID=UPI003D785B75
MAQEGSVKRGNTLDSPVDLISNLPRGVIDVIMDNLPLCDVARMSVVSHFWLDIWRSIQKLQFDAQFFKRVLKDKILDTNEFSRIVSKILFHYSGHLRKFHLYIPSLKSCPDVDQWICYLSRTSGGVSDVYIQSQYMPSIKLSSHIFSCGNLETLRLQGFRIIPPHNFEGFRNLTRLELYKIVVNQKSFNHLVTNCPLLQRLRLVECFGLDRIVIDFRKLSHLSVDTMFVSLDVKNAVNLVAAYFGLDYSHEVSHQTCFRVFIKALASSRNLQVLIFKGQFCKAFFMEPLLPLVFQKLRKLALLSISLDDMDEFYTIINVIRSFPTIERLYIVVAKSKHLVSGTVDYNPNVALHRLCYAYVSICSGSILELKLIEFLLACSPNLNRLSITTTGDRKTVFQQKMMNQLVRFRRASQKVEVICPEPPSPDIL